MKRININGTRYYVTPDREVGVSVTEFIGKVYPTSQHLQDWWIDNSREHIEGKLQRTQDFGTHFHELAEDFAQGYEVDVSAMDSKMQHYMLSLQHLFNERNIEPLHVERRVFHRASDRFPLTYGGTLDLECMIDWNGGRRRALLDYKSGNIYPKNKFQLMAYMLARKQTDQDLDFLLLNFNPNNWRRKPTANLKRWKITNKDWDTFASFCTIYYNEFHRLPSTIRQFSSAKLGSEPTYEDIPIKKYIEQELNKNRGIML